MSSIPLNTISDIASSLNLSQDELILQALRLYLTKELHKIQTEIYRICGKYEVKTASEIDNKYREGKLEEKNSWEDYFKLDHLEYKRRQILDMMKKINDRN